MCTVGKNSIFKLMFSSFETGQLQLCIINQLREQYMQTLQQLIRFNRLTSSINTISKQVYKTSNVKYGHCQITIKHSPKMSKCLKWHNISYNFSSFNLLILKTNNPLIGFLSLFYLTTDLNYSKQQWPTPRIK